ncbi:MAG: FAD-dependent oxidoreductase [Victivallales bacterium]
MKFIIIGNGPAGFYAAKKLRSNVPDCSITMFDRESLPFYTKIRLPDLIAGKVEEKKLFLSTLEDYKKSALEIHLDTEIASINPKDKNIVTSTGRIFLYDKLVIATGAKAFRPNTIKGISNDGVYALRTISDARQIMDKMRISQKAVVLGGGLLGLELAQALNGKGLRVDVIEFFPRLLPKQLNESEAAILLKKLETQSLSFFLDRITTEIVSNDNGLIVRTNRNDEIKADFIIVSAGIKTEINLAEYSGLKTEFGIIVNDKFETSEKDIYAIGDCAQFDGKTFGLWAAAKEQGEALADIVSGKRAAYKPSAFNPGLKVTGISLDEIRKEANDGSAGVRKF